MQQDFYNLRWCLLSLAFLISEDILVKNHYSGHYELAPA